MLEMMRCLTRDVKVNNVSLRSGDRLEQNLPDIGLLEDLELPSEIIFWRCSRETLTRHRNPIFDLGLGFLDWWGLALRRPSPRDNASVRPVVCRRCSH